MNQEELRDAVRGYISSLRYSSTEDSNVDMWLERLTETVSDAIKGRQERKAKEATA